MGELIGRQLLSTSATLTGTTSTTVGAVSSNITVRQFEQTDYSNYTVTVVNPSTRTGLNVYIKATEVINSSTYHANLTNFNVSAATTSAAGAEIRPVEGWLAGIDGRITIANDSTFSTASANAVTAYVVVRKG